MLENANISSKKNLHENTNIIAKECTDIKLTNISKENNEIFIHLGDNEHQKYSIISVVNDIILKKFGIFNIGNNCYILSCLQVLLHNKSFMEKFLEKIPEILRKSDSITYKFFMICK